MVSGTGVSDHPRSRGEYVYQRCAGYHQGGSSPLSRGIRVCDDPPLPAGGIIPALAGNTVLHSTTTSETPGSSPLSRGIRRSIDPARAARRIIPALAGNTTHRCSFTLSSTDHPRSRGEYAVDAEVAGDLGGSSPLSRGILTQAGYGTELRGIIPALAGNTPDPSSATTATGDHPRSRGEYGCLSQVSYWLGGSSPLSRGIHYPLQEAPHRVRIIPALAGNTAPRGAFSATGGDHPRSRGEYPR